MDPRAYFCKTLLYIHEYVNEISASSLGDIPYRPDDI